MIEILMATYNGEKYISEQIESILSQTYTEWKLLVRDDGSTDKTLEIVEHYVKKYPDKISIVRDDKGGLKAKENFIELLRVSTAEYIMFCDQDDIWLPHKVELTLKKMKEKENGPTLIHTDLKVVDRNLNIIADSMWKYQKLIPTAKQYNRLIIQNNITGCTIMMNRVLVNISVNEYPNGMMHDWIIGIIASLKGTIDYVDEGTILYRQHGNNDVGAQEFYKGFFGKIKKIKEINRKKYQTNSQLNDILLKIDIEDKNLKKKLEEYVNLPKKGFFYRKYWLIKNNFFKQGLLRAVSGILLY